MHVGEIGKLIRVYPNNLGVVPVVSLSTATCNLCVRGPATSNIDTEYPLTVSTDGTYAYYVTQAGDFPVDGVYQCQLTAQYPSGMLLKGDYATLSVDPSLC